MDDVERMKQEIRDLKAEVETLKQHSAHHDNGLALVQRLVNALLAKSGFKERIDA
jgi:hypothetical protein